MAKRNPFRNPTGKMSGIRRKFNGQTYTRFFNQDTKAGAQKTAKMLRKKGAKIRINPYTDIQTKKRKWGIYEKGY